MERAIRFAAGEWSENGKLNRDKFASTLAGIASKVMGAKPASSAGMTRPANSPSPSSVRASSHRTGPHRNAGNHGAGQPRQAGWIGSPRRLAGHSVEQDRTKRPRRSCSSRKCGGEEESTFNDDDGMIKAIATELKGQRWDTDKAAWK
jgi:hypothetical protein